MVTTCLQNLMFSGILHLCGKCQEVREVFTSCIFASVSSWYSTGTIWIPLNVVFRSGVPRIVRNFTACGTGHSALFSLFNVTRPLSYASLRGFLSGIRMKGDTWNERESSREDIVFCVFDEFLAHSVQYSVCFYVVDEAIVMLIRELLARVMQLLVFVRLRYLFRKIKNKITVSPNTGQHLSRCVHGSIFSE